MSRVGDEFGGPAKKRSGWLIPLAVFVVTATLSAVVLAYYFAPGPADLIAERPAPTQSTAPVALSVGGVHFHIPANYIQFASTRRGGTLKQVDMVALLPDLQGYSLGAAQAFASDAPDARVIDLSLREGHSLAAEEKLTRLYMPLVQSQTGTPADNALTVYDFRADTGYRDEQLYVGDGDDGPVLLRCTRPAPDVPSPSCLGDMALTENLTLDYRFKRGQLAHWHEIAAGLRALLGAFMDKG